MKWRGASRDIIEERVLIKPSTLFFPAPFQRRRTESLSRVFHGARVNEPIEKGDCVHLEMTTVYGGYWNQLVPIIAVCITNTELERFHRATVATTQSGRR